MRAALLIVAFMAMVAMAYAQVSAYGTLKGTYYTDNGCTAGSTAVTLTGSATVLTPCVVVSGTGTSAVVATGNCYSYSYAGYTESYWNFQIYAAGSTCVTSTGAVTGTETGGAFDASATSNIFPDTATKGAFYVGTGCFIATSCSNGASTLVVPSFLLVALAFAARKLSL
jgi:cytochrome c oxidase assembly protein Cox11